MTMCFSPHQYRSLLGTCALLVLVSCTSKAAYQGPPLPFRIALLPIEHSVFKGASEDAEGMTSMTISIDPTAFADQLVADLEGMSFVRIATVSPPHFGDENVLDRAAIEDALITAAIEADADLLLECKLEYAPTILCEQTVFGGVGWFLFALGGPFGILLEEHTFYADVTLHATFYDAAMMDEGDVRLGSAAGRVVLITASFPGIALDMIDRADGPADYAMSLIMPAGFIATESDSLQETIHGTVLASLSQQLADRVLKWRDRLIRSSGEEAGVFAFDPDRFVIDRRADGSLKVSGEVRLFTNPVVDRMNAYRISLGSTGEWVEFEDVPTQPATDSHGSSKLYAFESVLQPGDAETLKLELMAGSRDRYMRSYTFLLEPSSQ